MSESETTALEIIPKESALAVLTDQEKFDAFFERVAETVRGVEPDLTTAAGRKAVAALAFKVVKSKTAIVAAADLLTEDARATVAKVNASKKEIEAKLNALRDEVRKPLTDWESEEEAREKRATEMVDLLRRAAIITTDATVSDLKAMRETVVQTVIDSHQLGDKFQIAMNLRDTAVEALSTGITRAEQAEADAAELAALREQTAERDRQDAERQETERVAEEARQTETRRQQEEADQRERDRIAEEQRVEQERVAEEQRVAREKQVAEEAAAAERKRIADAAEVERLAQERRAANVKHQSKIMGEAKDAIMALFPVAMHDDEKEAFAKAIVSHIVRGSVPHTTITF